MDTNLKLDNYPFSKSLLQRSLLAISCCPKSLRAEALSALKIFFNDTIKARLSSDSFEMLNVVESFLKGESSYVINESATALRFWITRLIFEPGEYQIKVGSKLLTRPWEQILEIAKLTTSQVYTSDGIIHIKTPSSLVIPTAPISVPTQTTSHFASAMALLLCALENGPKAICFSNEFESKSFLDLTLNQIEKWGASLLHKESDSLNQIECLNKILWNPHTLGVILNSGLQLDAGAVFFYWLYSSAKAKRVNPSAPLDSRPPLDSTQPDAWGFEFVSQNLDSKEVSIDLSQVPDLFPVLSIYCAHNFEKTTFTNTGRLKTKESNRVDKIKTLLHAISCRFNHDAQNNSLVIYKATHLLESRFNFDSESDHRIVMAAHLAQAYGHAISINDPLSIKKSFPQFLELKTQPFFIFGHRGTGKTTYLNHLLKTDSQLRGFDIDKIIELKFNESLTNIFNNLGEAAFRDLELQTVIEVIENSFTTDPKKQTGVALGGGFEKWEALKRIYPDAKYIWLQRESDLKERYFLNRPRLSHYAERIKTREEVFKKVSTNSFLLEEGFDSIPPKWDNPSLAEFYFTPQVSDINLDFLKFGIRNIELRSDIFSPRQIELFLQSLPPVLKVLISQRTQDFSLPQESSINYLVDRDIEFINPKNLSRTDIVSFHGTSLNEALVKFGPLESHSHLKFKLVLFTKSWSDLVSGYRWMMQNPSNRVFLPATPHDQTPTEPLWKWFRLWLLSKNPILNFVKTHRFSIADQPSVLEVSRLPSAFNCFGAVLGFPINHSRSPEIHSEFFKKMNIPFFKIPIERNDFKIAIEFLSEIGLKFAAVTSPLKELSFEFANNKSQKSKVFQIANTLLISDNQTSYCEITDKEGLESLLDQVPELGEIQNSTDCVVWGGGAMQTVLKSLLKKATYYSASLGQPRDGEAKSDSPRILIWACGESHSAPLPETFKPRVIIDLSYSDTSPAIKYAQDILPKARYINGAKMFARQAALQRRFWESHL
jgi:5-enolpyruvylshikimate-3-phosphate synthase/shikimate 5-dehydrogenase/shikimate kinase